MTPEDLSRLVCPVCHQALRLESGHVVCIGCARRYPILDGIPVLLAERAS
ncbi:Trm112 family protein [Edaphobacter bradus]